MSSLCRESHYICPLLGYPPPWQPHPVQTKKHQSPFFFFGSLAVVASSCITAAGGAVSSSCIWSSWLTYPPASVANSVGDGLSSDLRLRNQNKAPTAPQTIRSTPTPIPAAAPLDKDDDGVGVCVGLVFPPGSVLLHTGPLRAGFSNEFGVHPSARLSQASSVLLQHHSIAAQYISSQPLGVAKPLTGLSDEASHLGLRFVAMELV